MQAPAMQSSTRADSFMHRVLKRISTIIPPLPPSPPRQSGIPQFDSSMIPDIWVGKESKEAALRERGLLPRTQSQDYDNATLVARPDDYVFGGGAFFAYVDEPSAFHADDALVARTPGTPADSAEDAELPATPERNDVMVEANRQNVKTEASGIRDEWLQKVSPWLDADRVERQLDDAPTSSSSRRTVLEENSPEEREQMVLPSSAANRPEGSSDYIPESSANGSIAPEESSTEATPSTKPRGRKKSVILRLRKISQKER